MEGDSVVVVAERGVAETGEEEEREMVEAEEGKEAEGAGYSYIGFQLQWKCMNQNRIHKTCLASTEMQMYRFPYQTFLGHST